MKLQLIQSNNGLALSITLIAIVLVGLPGAALAAPGDTTRISVDSSGAQADGWSYTPSISSDGRYVAFESLATNLVTGDTNGAWDIFLRDRTTGATTRVSVDSSGGQADTGSYFPSISSDGRYVAFESQSTNLVTGDTNGYNDIFVRDRTTGITTRVSVDSSGVQADDSSTRASISSDGRYVAFISSATNLVVGDTNGVQDVFMHDRTTGATTRVSVDSSGAQGNDGSYDPSVSSDGRYVAFYSDASNLVGGDTNVKYDIFVRDTAANTTARISVATGGAQADGYSELPSISSDGRYVAFASNATNLVAGDTNGTYDIFVHDRTTGATTRVSVDSSGAQGNGGSYNASFSSDGHCVAFYSNASNLVAGDTNLASDIFMHDQTTGATMRASVDSSGIQGNNNSFPYPSISSDGRTVAFESYATNLVAGDTNGEEDIFVREMDVTPPYVIFSVPADASVFTPGPTQLTITFTENVKSDGSADAADNVANYLLVENSANGVFNTVNCSGGVIVDDVNIAINSATYNTATFTATININGGVPLPVGIYTLLVCGTTSIEDLEGNKLNGGLADTGINFVVAAAPDAAAPAALPSTGFTPDRVTLLPEQTVSYAELGDLWLEIPKLGVQMPIVGVPTADGEWDVSWLGQDAGWLQGSAFPTWAGNSVLTGHVWNADNTTGPFRYINTLWWGDKVIVHAWGAQYVYQVRSVQQVGPGSTAAMLKHEDLPWVTLVTCRGYDEVSNSYTYRVLVRAVLVEVK